MEDKILGLHHITAIAGDPQRNHHFYTRILGLRMVKKTVNFDDPQTYHLYYADEVGTPGTLLTFFPWPGVKQGRNGTGMATEIGYSVPLGSLDFWEKRFAAHAVDHFDIDERFGEKILLVRDPDGLLLSLVETRHQDNRQGWTTGEVNADVAIKGFHSVTLTLNSIRETAEILTAVFGYRQVDREGNTYRFKTDHAENAAIVDLLESPGAPRGINAGGTNHHVAFRVKDEQVLMAFREKVMAKDLQITEKINRKYFFSLYFREPGGVLFEIATDHPGMAVDEPVEKLGTSLKLPEQYEPMRDRIEAVLPELEVEV